MEVGDGEHAVEVDVAAIDVNVLSGGVRGLGGGEQEGDGGGDLFREGHASAEGNLVDDFVKCGSGGIEF